MYWMNDSIDEDDGERVFPMLCTYVTIKLDAVRSVEILEDEEATAAARAQDAVSKVYVGYVADVRRSNYSNNRDRLRQFPSGRRLGR